MATGVQWVIDQLFAQLRAIQTRSNAAKAQISINNAHLMELDKGSASIADPAARSRFRAWIALGVKRQGEIARRYRSLSGQLAQIAVKVGDFLKAHGINPSAGLSDVGAAPLLVPIGISALVIASIAAVRIIESNNKVQTTAIGYQREALQTLTTAGATPDQLLQTITAAERAAAASAPPVPDPFGGTAMLKAAAPLVLAIAGVVLLPPIIEALRSAMSARRTNPRRRLRRRYA